MNELGNLCLLQRSDGPCVSLIKADRDQRFPAPGLSAAGNGLEVITVQSAAPHEPGVHL